MRGRRVRFCSPRCAALIPGMFFTLLAIAACEVPPKKPADTSPEPPARSQPAPPPPVINRPDVPPDVHTADRAAEAVRKLQSIESLWTLREIRLHAALYREAYAGIVAETTRHLLLQPMPAAELPTLAVEDREFYLRVLAELAGLDEPVAWTTIEPPAPEQSEHFPGTREPATRLSFEILQRDDDAATVIANVMDTTAHVGSSRQRVTATFDGRDWQVTRNGPRLIW